MSEVLEQGTLKTAVFRHGIEYISPFSQVSAITIEGIYVKYKNPGRILQLVSNKDIHLIKEMLGKR